MKFLPKYTARGSTDVKFTEEEWYRGRSIRNTGGLTAMTVGGRLVESVLDAVPNDYKREAHGCGRGVLVSAQFYDLASGDYPRRPGWSQGGDHVVLGPGIALPCCNSMVCVLSQDEGYIPLAFAKDEVEVQIEEGVEVQGQIEEGLHETAIQVRTYPSGTMVAYGPTSLLYWERAFFDTRILIVDVCQIVGSVEDTVPGHLRSMTGNYTMVYRRVPPMVLS